MRGLISTACQREMQQCVKLEMKLAAKVEKILYEKRDEVDLRKMPSLRKLSVPS